MDYKKPPQEEQVVLGGLHVAGLLGCWVARVAGLLDARLGGRLPIQSSF